jgi:hypothetical protein
MQKKNYDIAALHIYTSLFSESVYSNLLRLNDFSVFDAAIRQFDSHHIGEYFSSYWEYLSYVYKILLRCYRNEYVYKNCFLNDILIKQYGLRSTVAFSEFKVGNAIADLALFNGTSKAFEIKTEMDNERRLNNQLEEYAKLFEECFIVVPEDLLTKYEKLITDKVGIVVFAKLDSGRYQMKEMRTAMKNESFDADVMMRSVRCQEYKNMTQEAYGKLPDVSCFEMYDKCKLLLEDVDRLTLQRLFLNEIKKRKNNTSLLRAFPKEIRQLCLSMNLNMKKYDSLKLKMDNLIKL